MATRLLDMSNIINPYRFAAAGGGGAFVAITPDSPFTEELDPSDSDYYYVEFTGNSGFTVTNAGDSGGSTAIEYLVIGGGGGGGGYGDYSSGGATTPGGAGGSGVVIIRWKFQ